MKSVMPHVTNLQPTSYSVVTVSNVLSKISNKTKIPTLTPPVQHGTGSCSQRNKAGKRNKRHINKKGRGINVFVCR